MTHSKRTAGVPAAVVLLAGVGAALQVGKLPPALPVLRDSLGISLLESGFLLSLVQVAGMSTGLLAGLAADAWGLRRSMFWGLVLLTMAGIAGGATQGVTALLVLRALEGAGFLMVAMPAPGLLRRLVRPEGLSRALGLWGAYMPLGTATALLLGPWVIAVSSWSVWWWVLSAYTGAFAWAVWQWVPADAPGRSRWQLSAWMVKLRMTLGSRGPWMLAAVFGLYSGQWLAVVGFLPSIYARSQVGAGWVAVLTALAAAVNMVGNILAGRLLHRGVRPERLLYGGFLAMGLGAALAFAHWDGGNLPPWVQYAGVLLFSSIGGMVPGTLFAQAVQVAPDEQTVSTTIGWMQQLSSLGQFAGPPVVAWMAVQAGGWQWTWVATGACALLGAGVAGLLGRYLNRRPGD